MSKQSIQEIALEPQRQRPGAAIPDRELLQQALEALLTCTWSKQTDAAIAALRKRLAQPEQCNDTDSPWLVCKSCAAEGKCKREQPVQEPVAWSWEHDGRVVNAFPFKPDAEFEYWKAKGWTTRPLVYGDTAPQPRQWQGLTQEDMPDGDDLVYDDPRFIKGMAWADAKLREKNGGKV